MGSIVLVLNGVGVLRHLVSTALHQRCMNFRGGCLPVFGLVMALAGCAPTTMTPKVSAEARGVERQKQYELVLEANKRHIERGHRIYSRMARANTDSCPVVKSLMGVYMVSRESYKGAELAAAIKVYNLVDDSPVVIYSASETVQIGDAIRKVEGNPVSRAADVARLTPTGDGPVRLTVRRGSQEIDVVVPRVPQCSYGYRVVNQSLVNAFVTGTEIIFTTGMIQYAASDDELAIVTGHELAHNVENHVDKQKGNQLAGMLLGAIVGGQPAWT